MKRSRLLLAGTIAAAAWCTALQAQTILYGAEHRPADKMQSESAYPKHPPQVGYAVSGYWDNGVWWQRTDPVAVDSRGGVTYVNPGAAPTVYPPSTIIYSPGFEPAPYGDRSNSARGISH